MAEVFANEAQTTLSAGITSGATALSLTDASAFPTSGTFRIRVEDAPAGSGVNREFMTVTAVSGSTLTVARGQEGASAVAHGSGSVVTAVVTAAALFSASGGWLPFDQNLLGWAFDPLDAADTGAQAGAGTLYVSRIKVVPRATLASLIVGINTAGAGLTLALGGVYLPSGTLIAKTASQVTAWTSTGVKVMALAAEPGQSLTLPDGVSWVHGAMVANGTTRPTFSQRTNQVASTDAVSTGLSTTDARFGFVASQTDIPSTRPTLSISSVNNYRWMALA